MELNCFLYWT